MEEMEPTVVIQSIIFENEKFITNSSSKQESDSVIIFNGKHRIPINKSLMMERCAFFKYMIKHGFKEANAKEISIGYNADVTVFKSLVDYIHTGKIRLTTSNLEAVIVASIYFQLRDLLKFCCDVMMRNTDHKTVGQVYEFAKELALVELRKAAVLFEVKNFNEIAKSKVFYEWLASCMLELLSSDEIEVSHEKKVLKFVFDWLNVDPSKRAQYAAEMFRKLRFTFLNKKIMEQVSQGNSNAKLAQIFHQVAREFSNKITSPRIYDKGVYMYGYNREMSELLGGPGFRFVRYCPGDGNITVLSKPNIGPSEMARVFTVVNNKDIFMVKYENQLDSWKIHMEKYDAKKDVWKTKASATFENHCRSCSGKMAVYQEKIFVFLTSFGDELIEFPHFCMVYCIKTNTWQRLPAFDGKWIWSAATCGDSIYMTRRDSTNLLQYKPSTGELTDIPCQYNLGVDYVAIAYKSSILFVSGYARWFEDMAYLFNTDTNVFGKIDLTETYKANNICYLEFSPFKDSVFAFTTSSRNVFKLDLSFIDEVKEPSLVWSGLQDITEMNLSISDIISIQ